MNTIIPELVLLEPVLNSADAGLALARRVLEALDRSPSVRLNFADVERITPSFSNAFVMTLLEKFPREELRNRFEMVNRRDVVLQAINESVRRYQQGIRLTTQRPENGNCANVACIAS